MFGRDAPEQQLCDPATPAAPAMPMPRDKADRQTLSDWPATSVSAQVAIGSARGGLVHVAGSIFPVGRSKFAFEDLARRGNRKGVRAKLDRLGTFIPRDLGLAVRD